MADHDGNGDGAEVHDLSAHRGEPGDPDGTEPEGDEPQEKFAFGIIDGDGPVNLKSLIKRGLPVETEVSLMSAAVPARGMIAPDKAGQLVVSYHVQKYEVVPVREGGEESPVRWKVRMQLRPTYVISAAIADDEADTG